MRTLADQPFLHIICKQSASSVALKAHRRHVEFRKDVDYALLYVIRLPVVAYPTVNVILITVFIDYRHSAVVAALFFRIANGKVEDVSVKKLTKDNPTMQAEFEKLKNK